MYNKIAAFSTPLIVIHAVLVHLRWINVERSDDIVDIFNRQAKWIIAAAGCVFVVGVTAVYEDEKKKTKADPLFENMAGRLAAISILSVAILLSGATVNNCCYNQLTRA
jgi:hypothetical protein